MTELVKVTTGPGRGVSVEARELIESAALTFLIDHPEPNLSPLAIAKAIGVNYQTFYRLMDQHPGFGQRIRAALAIADRASLDEVHGSHFDLATGKSKAGNVLAQIHILKNRDKRYREDRKQGPTITINIDKAQIALAQSSAANVEQLAAGEEDE